MADDQEEGIFMDSLPTMKILLAYVHLKAWWQDQHSCSMQGRLSHDEHMTGL